MKTTIKYLTALTLSLFLTSCLVDDDVTTDAYDQGPNLSGFTSAAKNLNAVTNGDEYNFTIDLRVIGPNVSTSTEDVNVTVAVDPASTAVAGTHYTLGSMSTTLLASNNYIGSLPITMITNGIMAPLAENPVLILNVTDSSGGGTVVNGSTGTTTLTFVYQCFADMSGTYLVTNTACNNPFMTTISPNDDGSWFMECGDGGLLHRCTANTGLVNWGNVTELCGDILPSTSLRFGSDNFGGAIGDISGGTWDAVSSTITMDHTQLFTGNWPGAWSSTYVRQ